MRDGLCTKKSRYSIMSFTRKLFLIIFCSMWMIQTSSGQHGSGAYPSNAESGKCYAQCNVDQHYELYRVDVPIYNGEILNQYVDSLYVQYFDSSNVHRVLGYYDELKAKHYSRQEISELKKVYVVQDTVLEKNYFMEMWAVQVLENRGKSPWLEVMCNDKITPQFVEMTQKVLTHQGYMIEAPMESTMSKGIVRALKAFQSDNDFPQGNLDLKTVAKLRELNAEFFPKKESRSKHDSYKEKIAEEPTAPIKETKRKRKS